MATSAELQARRVAAIPRGVGNVTQIFAKTAKNAEIWSEDGKRYIDFGAGIAVVNTGHQHPRLIKAIEEQLKAFSHVCFQVTPYENYVSLAERLNAIAPIAGPAKTMLASTGAEAVENAVKVARAFTGRPGIVSFAGGFHGRTLMGMALTGKVVPYKKGYGPFPPDVYNVEFPNVFHGGSTGQSIRSLKSLFKHSVDPSNIAGIVIEPVQGEGGFNIVPKEFMVALRELCDDHGILLIADEIQTGFARTGKMFAMEHFGVKADVVTMAKGLAGGMPLSAIVGRADVMDASNPGGLGGTYAGNPVACASAHAVLDVIHDEKLCDRATAIGKIIMDRCSALQANSNLNCIGDVRGLGAMCAVELVKDKASGEPAPELTSALLKAASDRGLILLSCGTYGNVIRFLVPLTASDELVREGMDVFESALTDAVAKVA
ncbi:MULTISPECIES: 4-aminobutyrate--2-oxoglutarate transaminase [unclassified Hyphomicrobium]|uniref:4-aminobutyrate--2-oxoglutarate transaminase n=1 Tax=unclassified Hyphomicrobium TaxID=2619925 RepID=UPI000213E8F3|nr:MULTISPECIES: 4-aminobutyrate--2-oxoglutarate transaminase [unclassified Hyphomicrobium]CCB65974.1 4-aminobutyrate aminotransferase (Gamma-amino-N-butyrate transaminase) (GABA transaminase) (Glutamate:succinic semialdehyde transaminase) (GABA aminotransferase) (GABA-AT) [Hyphomicrobium sp. MC1]